MVRPDRFWWFQFVGRDDETPVAGWYLQMLVEIDELAYERG